MPVTLDKSLVKRLLSVVDKGLTYGMGDPVPGEMCVEAAVCYAYGEPHGDEPKCVAYELAAEKISLNDRTEWRSEKARAKGLRRLAVAQLGSKKHFDQPVFDQSLQELATTYFTTLLRPGDFAKIDDFEYCVSVVLSTMRGSPRKQQRFLQLVCEDVVQVLVKMKVPGTKFLYLCGGKKRPSKLKWPAKKVKRG